MGTKLKRVLVAGDNQRIEPFLFSSAGQRPDDIVRLIALQFQIVNMHGVQNLLHGLKFHRKFRRHLPAARLVVLICLVPESGRAHIPCDCHIIRIIIIQNPIKHI